jgi:hypothetical protein
MHSSHAGAKTEDLEIDAEHLGHVEYIDVTQISLRRALHVSPRLGARIEG